MGKKPDSKQIDSVVQFVALYEKSRQKIMKGRRQIVPCSENRNMLVL